MKGIDDNRSRLAVLQRRNDELKTLLEVGKVLTSTLQLDEILRTVMEKVGGLLRCRIWSLLLVDEASGELTFEIAVSPAAEQLRAIRLHPGEGIAGWVAKHGEPVLVNDVQKDPRFAREVDRAVSFSTHSVVCVPIKSKERSLGVIQLINPLGEGEFGKADLSILSSIADFVAIAIENARNFEKISDLAVTDDLTGLFNARHFHSLLEYEIERSARVGSDLSLVFFDLDHFKTVNDTYGHRSGSKLLAEIGDLLKGSIRRVDRAARYGGDEFVLILPATPKQGAFEVATKLRRKIRTLEFLTEDGSPVEVTASFGIASFPEDAGGKEDLIRLADQAMYEAKQSSRDTVRGL